MNSQSYVPDRSRFASGHSDFIGELNQAIRQNPVPAALIGVGIAWLFMGGRHTVLGGASRSAFRGLGHGAQQAGGAAYQGAKSVGELASAGVNLLAEGATQAGSRAANAARTATDAIGDTIQQTAATMADVASSGAAYGISARWNNQRSRTSTLPTSGAISKTRYRISSRDSPSWWEPLDWQSGPASRPQCPLARPKSVSWATPPTLQRNVLANSGGILNSGRPTPPLAGWKKRGSKVLRQKPLVMRHEQSPQRSLELPTGPATTSWSGLKGSAQFAPYFRRCRIEISMPKPVVIDISHELGKDEARRRLQKGFGRIRDQFGVGALAFEERWEAERLHFTAGFLGQKVAGRIDVMERSVRIELGFALGARRSGRETTRSHKKCGDAVARKEVNAMLVVAGLCMSKEEAIFAISLGRIIAPRHVSSWVRDSRSLTAAARPNAV